MEVFVECLIKRHNSAKTVLLEILTVLGFFVGSVIVFFLITAFSPTLALIAAAAAAFGCWWLLRRFQVEYEYILTNDTLDVDKIIAKSSRKRVISINLREIEMLAPANDAHRREFQSAGIQTKIDATDGSSSDIYFIKTPHQKLGMTVLLFSPDERIFDGVKSIVPRKVIDE